MSMVDLEVDQINGRREKVKWMKRKKKGGGEIRLRASTGETYGEEKITDIVRDVYRDAHLRKMEAVTQRDEGQRHDVVQHEFFEVLARLLQLQHQHDGLLRPVTGLQQVVRLEDALVLAVREPFKHRGRVEVPQRASRHDVQPEGPEDAEVDRGVPLFHEPRLFSPALDPGPQGQRANEALHEELARERKHDGVEGHEGQVLFALAVPHPLRRVRRIDGAQRVGEEDRMVERVRG